MLENQENQAETVEPTVEEKITTANLDWLANAKVKPLLDILGLEVQGKGWYSGPTAEEVTVRRELEELNKSIVSKDNDIKSLRDRIVIANGKASDVEEYLDENWDSIDEEVREKLCDIFGIEDTVTKTVTINISGTVDITAPRGYDWDNIAEDINYDLDIKLENSDLDTDGYGWSPDDFQAEI